MERTELNFFKIEKFDELESTNEYAKKCSADGTVIVARSQTKGKGRLGRSWDNNPDEALTFSIFLKPDVSPEVTPMITLVSAMAVRAAVGDMAKIKWPNDVVINGKKVVGILTEMAMEDNRIKYVITGIGVNVNVRTFAPELKDKATSLYIETGKKQDMDKLLSDILEHFKKYYDLFLKTCDMSLLMEEYNSTLVNVNERVRIVAADGFSGIARGIDRMGELVVEKENGELVTVRSGEVSVRGIYGYV